MLIVSAKREATKDQTSSSLFRTKTIGVLIYLTPSEMLMQNFRYFFKLLWLRKLKSADLET